ncbi:uncharacterized protein RCC_00382 [Ramularia collo-cygni]|uniref:Uncharacterized protein n=1 Tax=Ramularia collo-cygni TaxID=112498 RepID=A0A2D3UP14_9PEZI|nr:uncharacterized protein RCC_00382 [Ramularia collo-cygni]CZT14405.1 uncharacterized protein RCC_00382 [Ramularia collo-cygni]
MAFQTAFVTLLALTYYATASHLHPRQSSGGVDINNLSKNVNGTSGTGDVSASGNLAPFGGIGVGCGINWAEGVSYGGGLQAGSSSFGLGGGYTIRPEEMEVGAGIGFTKTNSSASIQFTGSTNGTFGLTFSSSSPFVCIPSFEDGQHSVKCTTALGY